MNEYHKQFGKGDYVHQRPPNITQLSKTSSLKNVIKSIFYIELASWLNQGVGRKDSNAKKDGLTTSKGRHSKLMGG
jgi:hypothetical protein